MEAEIEEKRGSAAKSRTKKARTNLSKTEKSKIWEILDMDCEKRKYI